jgi:CheY-like chemotaxis protein
VHLVQVLVNVLVNAAQSIPLGEATASTISVRTRRVAHGLPRTPANGSAHEAARASGGPASATDESAADAVEIAIIDTGRGIPPHLLPHIFEPFFSSKPRGEGSGLGLAISKQIVDSFGGRIGISSQLGVGTSVSILLPAAETPRAQTPDVPDDRDLSAGRSLRILVVDDESAIANALRRLLTPHEVEIATDGRTALRRLQDGPDVDVILCDLMLPDIAGSEIFKRATERRPELRSRFIFMTGGAFVPEAAAFLDQCGCRVLDKPFDLERLQRYVVEVASQGEAKQGGKPDGGTS